MRAPPLDYAVDDGTDGSAPFAPERPAGAAPEAHLTLGALFARDASAAPVTDAMIRDAWRRMESGHGALPGAATGPASRVATLARTLRRLRPGT